jgi:hypothetical protein
MEKRLRSLARDGNPLINHFPNLLRHVALRSPDPSGRSRYLTDTKLVDTVFSICHQPHPPECTFTIVKHGRASAGALRSKTMLKAIIFDFGHTIMREDSCIDPHLQDCPIDLMPGAREAIEMIRLPRGIWANTRVATVADIRRWLVRAGLDQQISWVAASFELGCHKPEPEFFTRALSACGLQPTDVLFVGNQLDTDIVGANQVGIRCVYLADRCYRSMDEHAAIEAKPTFTIETLFELPSLIANLVSAY